MIKRVLVLVILFGVIAFVVFQIVKQEEYLTIPKKQKEGLERAVQEMVHETNAVADWAQALENKRTVYTIDFQETFDKISGRPLLFHAQVADILQRGDSYIIHFDHWALAQKRFPLGNVRLFLRASKDMAMRLRSKIESEKWPSFAVVASIDSIRKIPFTISVGNTLTGREGELLEYDILVEATDTFIFEGECLDFVYTSKVF